MSTKRNQRGGRHAGSGVETQVALAVEPFTPAPKVADAETTTTPIEVAAAVDTAPAAAVDPSTPPAVDPTAVSAAVDPSTPPAVDPSTPPAVDPSTPPAVDPTPAAAVDTPLAGVDTPTTTQPTTIPVPVPTEATEASHSQFVDTPRTHEDTQSSDDKAFKKKQDEKEKKIKEDIEQINRDADEKNEVLSKLYKDAESKYNNDPTEENYAKLEEISVSIDGVYDKKRNALDAIQKVLNGDTTPILVAGTKSLVNYGFNIIKAKFKKSKLEAQALEVAEDTMDVLLQKSGETTDNIKNGEEVNIDNMAKLTHLANDVAAANAPPPTPSSSSGLLGNAASAAAKALGGAAKDPAAATAAALGGAAGAADPAAKDPAAAAAAEEPAKEEPAAAEEPAPAAEEEEGEQEGGGISRKRSHPKYINQISENRNKIFKKELEIINSIRRFHRSHTIRKRDKINSILGFKKSKNNRNRNHGNTRRHHHKHRHNNHKHKSTKHIKKVM
jgi:hypothetical protein